ncbi:BRCA1-associated RING domain protein 1-like isoform X2 [Lineus longissimus]
MILRDPCTLKSCQHIFCRDCAEEYAGTVCPVCNFPSHMKDLEVNRNMKNIIKLAKYLNTLLYKGDQDAMSESESASNASALDHAGNVQPTEGPARDIQQAPDPAGEMEDPVQEDEGSDHTEDMEVDCQDDDMESKEGPEPGPETERTPSKAAEPSSVYDFIASPQAANDKKGKSVRKKKGKAAPLNEDSSGRQTLGSSSGRQTLGSSSGRQTLGSSSGRQTLGSSSGRQTLGTSSGWQTGRSSRSRTTKEKKTKRLQDINKSWRALSKCDSCIAKKGVKKTVRVVLPLSQEDVRKKEHSDVKDDGDNLECGDCGIQQELGELTDQQEPKDLPPSHYDDDVDGRTRRCGKEYRHLDEAEPYVSLEKLDKSDLLPSGFTKINQPMHESVGSRDDEQSGTSETPVTEPSDDKIAKALSGRMEKTPENRKKRLPLESDHVAATKKSHKSFDETANAATCTKLESTSSDVLAAPESNQERTGRQKEASNVAKFISKAPASTGKSGRKSAGNERKSSAAEKRACLKISPDCSAAVVESVSPDSFTTPVSSKIGRRRSTGGQKKLSSLNSFVCASGKEETRMSTSGEQKMLEPTTPSTGGGFPCSASSGKTHRKSAGSDQDVGIVTPGRKSSARLSTSSPASQLQKKNARGETPLHVVAIKGDVVKVRAMLVEGANPNTKDNAGWTPLHEAANHGFTEIVKALLDHGAFINAPAMDNDSPLLDAVQNNRLETVKLLVSRGADVSQRNSSGQTPMDCAQTREMMDALSTPVDQVEAPVVLPSTPTEFTRPERVVLLCTGLKRPEQMKVQKCASMLHGRIVTEFSPEVSHVITGVNSEGMCARTLKYLNAVLLGKWILNFEWVESCLQFSDRVCEEGFEVPGSSTHPESNTPCKGRENAEKQLPRLFDGCKIYFSGSFRAPTPEKKELVQLAKSGGATVLNREPKLENVIPNDITVPYHAKSGSYLADCCYFIIHDPNVKIKMQRHFRVCTAPTTWFMECITGFELLDLPEGNAD